jgi:hypothetical protein
MKPSFLNELSASFAMFVDHEICYKGEAFSNVVSGNLYPAADTYFNNNTIYQSSYRQWIVDESIASVGAVIPKKIQNGSSDIQKNENGLKIDYGMGRVFLNDTFPKDNQHMTASFSRKEFNIFLTSKDETQLLMSEPAAYNQFQSGVPNGAEPYPLIYVKNFYGENKPFAFGGMDESNFEFRCTVLADSAFKLDSVNSVLQDSARKNFPLIPSSGIPFNIYGDLKTGIASYNYFDICNQFGDNQIFIDSVRASKFDEKVNKVIKDGLWGGFIDFKLKALRYPRL